MSNFMLIAPEGWTEMNYEFITNNILDQYTMESLMLQGQPYEIDAALAAHGLLPEGKNIQEIKFIDNSFMWVRLG